VHEQALARTLLREVAAVCRQRRLGAVRSVAVELGELSGYEPALLASAFHELSAEWLGAAAELELRVVPLTAECVDCGTAFPIEDFTFVCPSCRSGRVRVVRGEEVRLLGLSAEAAEPAA